MAPNCIALRDSDVSMWSNNLVKISVNEVCEKFGIDIQNDRRNLFFWKIQLDKKVIVTDELLIWLGYTSARYCNRKQQFFHLLKKNPHVLYDEVSETCSLFYVENDICLWTESSNQFFLPDDRRNPIRP